MGIRTYRATLRDASGAERTVDVPSKTDVQAGDAAIALARPGESLVEVIETNDPYQHVDGPPAGTQTHPDRIV